ncbi:MAG: adenosylcobinamide-GDP ribazoletransferase [Sphaerospermopsis sp.]|nr:adenosylcobinamide-GDP ribazoletransferase [Sphaerospermopsis sp.]
MSNKVLWWKRIVLDMSASITFYTCIPIPHQDKLDYTGVARLAAIVGTIIGGILALCDSAMYYFHLPLVTRSALLVAIWIALTGGLHLDGVMDTADGLAVNDPKRRLEVMTESTTGAFGVMAGIILVLLKTAALINLNKYRWLVLMVVCGWGRWGQQLAILRYPYLKPKGKGAFHKVAITSYKSLIPGLLWLLGITGLTSLFDSNLIFFSICITVMGSAIAFLIGAWFNRKLGGHTGDTYGAVVEWTEALLICVATAL